METTHIAVDTSKSPSSPCTPSDPAGHCTGRLDLSAASFLARFAKLPPLTVTLEACGGSHHWGRELARLGHKSADRPAACQALRQTRQERSRRCGGDQRSGEPPEHALRAGEERSDRRRTPWHVDAAHVLVCQRTALVNALRGHASRVRPGRRARHPQVSALLAAIAEDAADTPLARELCAELGRRHRSPGRADRQLRSEARGAA